MKVNRRSFLSVIGSASVGLVAGCDKDVPAAGVQKDTPGQMTYRINPKDGSKVSILGYGCMRWPLMKDENNNEVINQEMVNRLVDTALEHGVNYFDTSPVYIRGFSEKATGIALSRHPRNSYYIATKLSNMHKRNREDSIAMYKQSMIDLKTDYFDYYLLHSLGTYAAFKERYLDTGMLDFLLQEREAGRIRNLGWSYHGQKEFFDFMMFESKIKWDFVQIQLNYYDWENLDGRSTATAQYQYETLAKLGVPAVIMEPLLGGRLAAPHQLAQKMLKQADPTSSIASWAFRFAGTPPNVLTVLSGMTFMEHLEDNLKTFCPLRPITASEETLLKRVSHIIHTYHNINCNDCQYCMPCPYGIDIPGIFKHHNRCMNEGNYPDDTKDPTYRQARRAFLVSLSRNVEKLRQADHCIGCRTCVPECPQGLDIPAEMQRISNFVERLKRDNA